MKSPIYRALSVATLAFYLIPCQAALTDGLVSYWPFESFAEGRTPDLVSTNHLSLVGAPAIGTSQDGSGALVLNGTTSYLTNLHSIDPSTTGLPIYNSGAYTITMWVKGPAQTAKYLFSEGSTTSNNPLLILQTGQTAANNARFDVIIRNNAGGGGGTPVNHVVSAAIVFDNTWHHIAWVDDNGDARLYVDGVLDSANFVYTPVPPISFNTTAVGTLVRAAISTGAIFNGSLDDVALWKRALTEAEINEVRTSGIPIQSQTFPPKVETQPVDVTRQVGDWQLFAPTFTGSRPFSFQWFRNGAPIPNATNETYRVSNLSTNNSGDFYSLSVSNTAGSITTSNAVITVLPDPAPDLRAGLVNHWPLNTFLQEGSLLRSPDLYSGNDMVLVDFSGPADTVEGKVGNALSFDFVSKFAYRTNGSPIYLNTNYSVAFWVKAPYETQNDRRVFSEGSSQNNNPLFTIGTEAAATSPVARVFIRGDSGAVTEVSGRASTRPVFDDTWHHIAWTDANGRGRLYIDGVLDETDFTYTRLPLTLDRTSLGAVLRATPGNFYFGALDEVVTWNRVLSWSEIQQVLADGIPPRISATPPSIIGQSSPATNTAFAGDIVSFSFQYAGSLPLSFQWFKDGQPIPISQNSSAGTDILTLTNVQPQSSGELYLVVTNVAGAATSSIVRLQVAPYTPPTTGEVLAIDAGLTGSSNLQPGFSEFNLGMNGRNFNGIGVTFSSIGGAPLAERNRTAGARITNNPPAMTQAQIYNDFIFANSTTDGTGLRVSVSRLAPNTPHQLTLWSYDPQSAGGRVTDWNETSSGTPVPIQLGYSFDGNVQPTNDFERTLTAVLTSSPSGQLTLEGTRAGGTSVAAFVNAIRLVANPGVSPLRITAVNRVSDRIRIQVEVPAEGQAPSLQQSSNLPADWTAATGGTIIQQSGRITVFEFPASAPRMFYRATVNP